MSVTDTRTVREIVTRALRKAGLQDLAEEPEAAMADEAMGELNDMLKAWQRQPWMWTRTAGSLTLTTAATYTLDPVRPVRILSARLKRFGIETPMEPLTRREYDELPQKASQGLPTTYFYDRQREAATFTVWPVLAAASGETVAYTYVREIEDVNDLNAEIDVPAEWYDAVVLSLAARVAMTFNVAKAGPLDALAREAMVNAGAFEMDEPVTFEADQ